MMFSDYEKILIDTNIESDILKILTNVNDNVIILYNQSNYNISKHLFRKGIENINFVCDNDEIIIKIGKPDLLISNHELSQICTNLCDKNNITTFNLENKNSVCGKCKKESNYLGLTKIGKLCSEECVLSDNPGFYELINKYKKDDINTKLEKSFSNSKQSLGKFKDANLDANTKKKQDKFQKIILLEAKRHNYQVKKDDYIRNIRKSSSNLKFDEDEDYENENEKTKVPEIFRMCKAMTKKGKMCSNKAINCSEYCGIISHKKMDPNYKSNNTKKTSSNKNFEKLMKGFKNNK